MLVSFASYHLWLDWRRYGSHLARLFTDYEPGITIANFRCNCVTGINTIKFIILKQSDDHDKDGAFIEDGVQNCNLCLITILQPSFNAACRSADDWL